MDTTGDRGADMTLYGNRVVEMSVYAILRVDIDENIGQEAGASACNCGYGSTADVNNEIRFSDTLVCVWVSVQI